MEDRKEGWEQVGNEGGEIKKKERKSESEAKLSWRERNDLETMVDAGRSPAVRLCGVFLAVCVKCVSLDTDGIPPEINPPGPPVPSTPTLHSLSTHHAYSSVCVWVCVSVCVWASVFTLDGGLPALYRGTCRGQQEKDSCVFERKQKT